MNEAKLKALIVKAAVEAVTKNLDVSEIVRLSKNGAGRSKKRVVKQKLPKPGSNIGLIYEFLLRHANTNVSSKRLEKLLLTRRVPGERVSGDAASVGSDINYLKKYYGFDIETVKVGVYRLHQPKRRR